MNTPCLGCEHRYRACQDTCQRPEYRKYREKLDLTRKKRQEYATQNAICAEETARMQRTRKKRMDDYGKS